MSALITTVAPLKLLGQPIPGMLMIKSGDRLLAMAKPTDTGYTTKGIQAQPGIKLDSRQRAHVTRMVKQNRIQAAPKPDVTTNPLYRKYTKLAAAAAGLR